MVILREDTYGFHKSVAFSQELILMCLLDPITGARLSNRFERMSDVITPEFSLSSIRKILISRLSLR